MKKNFDYRKSTILKKTFQKKLHNYKIIFKKFETKKV